MFGVTWSMLAVIASVLASCSLVRSTAAWACAISRSARSRYSVTMPVTADISRASRSSTNDGHAREHGKEPGGDQRCQLPGVHLACSYPRVRVDCGLRPTLSRMRRGSAGAPAPLRRDSGRPALRAGSLSRPAALGALAGLTARLVSRRPDCGVPALAVSACPSAAPRRRAGSPGSAPTARRSAPRRRASSAGSSACRQLVRRVLLLHDASRIIVRIEVALAVPEPGRAGVAGVAQMLGHRPGQAVLHVGAGRPRSPWRRRWTSAPARYG